VGFDACMTELPCAKDLVKLPIRAVVAYALRFARRLSWNLRNNNAYKTIEKALALAEQVVSSNSLEKIDTASILMAGANVLDSFSSFQSQQDQIIALAVIRVVTIASLALDAAMYSTDSRFTKYNIDIHYDQMQVAHSAEAVAHLAEAIANIDIYNSIISAKRDYEYLLKTYGEHETIIIGDPIDISDNSLLGPLL
jgi:tryptophan 2,3-dioxygenase